VSTPSVSTRSDYALLAKQQVREAIAVLELVAWAHPGLANAQDSLADAHLAAGESGARAPFAAASD
jgi:hypothetical protein